MSSITVLEKVDEVIVNEVSAQMVYPKVELYMNMTLVALTVYTIFYILGAITELCSHLDSVKKNTKLCELLETIQRFIHEGFPYLVFSLLNLLFYANWRFSTLLTGIIIFLAVIRHFFERRFPPEMLKNIERGIFACMVIQFCIFIYTNQDVL